MPSDKKRINLTIPDALYERLQAYKTKNGIMNDATACLQLITQQLKGQEQSEAMLKLISEASMEQLLEMSKDGYSLVKNAVAAQKQPDQ